MSRFFNDDYKVKAGGRNAARITQDELKTIIAQYGKKYVPDEYDENEEDFDYLIPTLLYECKDIEKDLKYDFDCENFTTKQGEFDVDDKYIGYQTLDNGLTFLGFYAGGDWECPIFGIIYYDGKKLRGYIPTRGQMVNRKSKAAIGNDEELDEEFLAEYEGAECSEEEMINEIKTRIIVKDDNSSKNSPMIVIRAALYVEDSDDPEIELTLTSQKYWDENGTVNDSNYIFDEDEVDEKFVNNFKKVLSKNCFGEMCESTYGYYMEDFDEDELRNDLKKLWKNAKAIGVEMKGDPLTEAFIAGGPCPYENCDFEW